MNSISINVDQGLFVIPCGDNGYTTMGFEYVRRELVLMMKRCSALADLKARVIDSVTGTLAQYRLWEEAAKRLAASGGYKNTWYQAESPGPIQRILEDYRTSRKRLRIFYGDRDTGYDHCTEYAVLGRIGRSSGILKVPLVVPDGDDGGDVIDDAKIVRMIDVDSRREVYRHRKYEEPVLSIVEQTGTDYPWAVYRNGTEHVAGFKRHAQANNYVAFMWGHSMTLP